MREIQKTNQINWALWIPAVLAGSYVLWKLVIPSFLNITGSWRSASWPETEGRVIVSDTYEFSAQERRQTGYRFRYRFVVSDKPYESSRYSFRYATGEISTAVKKHDVGDKISVYYDPARPSQSVIDRNSSSWWNYVVLGSMILIPVALVIRVRSLRSTKVEHQ